MILPNYYDAAAPATASSAFVRTAAFSFGRGDGDKNGNWSSLIGIVTALVGNVLISFALNTQRYAHTRLEREWQEKERRRKSRLRRAGYDGQGYGTQQIIAEERAAANADAAPENGVDYRRISEDSDGETARDTDPLIPSLPKPKRSSSDTRSMSQSSIAELAAMEHKQGSYLRSPYWWTGIILMTVGEAGNFLAYGFAPASIVSPLGVVALVSNCIIAPVMFKEPFRMRDFLGVIVAVAGAVTVVLSANDSNPKLGPDVIWGLITTWEFETYLGITGLCIICLMLASRKYGRKSILIDLGLVGIFGGYTALSTKGVASLLSYTLWRVLTFPIFYLLLFILIFTAVMQIKYVNRALQRFEATQVIPTQFVLFTLSVILGSAVLYRDFEKMNADHAGKFFGGCSMTFLGVWLITSKRPKANDEEDREPEPEDAINLVNGERHRNSMDERQSITVDIRRPSSPPIPISATSPRRRSIPQTPNITVSPQESTVTTPVSSFPAAPSSLTANPWEAEVSAIAQDPSGYQHHQAAPPMVPYPLTTQPALASLSAPILPSEAQILNTAPVNRPQTPRGASDLVLNTQGVHLSPQTPQGQTDRLSPDRPVSRGDRTDRDRPRHSAVGGALPAAPLFMTSPLSSSLSAVVAELRRGSGVRIQGSPLRPSGARRNTAGEDEMLSDRRRSATDNVTGETREENATDTGKTVRRGRSVSGTLGDLFRWMGDANSDLDVERSVGTNPGNGSGERGQR